MALTATAAPEHVASISAALGMVEPLLLRGPLRRANMRYAVLPVAGAGKARTATLLRLVAQLCANGRRGIIFCSSIKRTEELRDELRNGLSGVAVDAYHAQLDDATRREQEAKWTARLTQAAAPLSVLNSSSRLLPPPCRPALPSAGDGGHDRVRYGHGHARCALRCARRVATKHRRAVPGGVARRA